jgi:hypothetical protein
MDANRLRQRVAQMLPQIGLPNAEPLREAILMRGGRYYGLQLQFSGVTAVWCAAENEVTFFTPDGTVRHAAPLGKVRPDKHAA